MGNCLLDWPMGQLKDRPETRPSIQGRHDRPRENQDWREGPQAARNFLNSERGKTVALPAAAC